MENWLEEEIEYKYVLAQDPGGTSGIAVLRYTENTKPEVVMLHQIADGREGFFEFFFGTVVGVGTEWTSVSEKWVTREGIHSANLEPVYIEGMQYALWANQTHYQAPSVKVMVGDEFLKVNNLWTEGKRHQMDALLHGIYYLRSIGHEPTLEALANPGADPLEQPGEIEKKQLQQSEDGEPAHSLEDAMKSLAESAAQASEEIQALLEQIAGGAGGEDGEGIEEHKIEGTRKKRTLNGGFMGFDDDEV